jgi:hypothetical protein
MVAFVVLRFERGCVKRRVLRKETRLRVRDAIFCDELCSKRLSGIRLATEISLVLRRLPGL